MPPGPQLRLLAVNAASLPLDRHGVAQLIAELHPDIVCVHGAPSLLRWRSMCAAIAREAGMVVVSGGRTSGGNLLLSSLGVDVEAVRELASAGRRGPRPPGAALAALRLRGSAFRFVGARQLGSPTDRMRQCAELQTEVDALTPDRPPALFAVAGIRPDSTAWAKLAEGRIALPGGVFVDATFTVDDANEITGGGVRADLTLPT